MQSILLCGGKGERLRPLTQTIPKPLVPIKNRPIIDYIVNHLAKYDIKDIVIAAGCKLEKMREHFLTKLNVRVVDSGDVDIIKRILDCSRLIESDFLLFYGDTLSDVDLTSLISFHKCHDSLAIVTAWPIRSQFGIMDLDNDALVTQFKEKPTLDKWVNIGHYLTIGEKVAKNPAKYCSEIFNAGTNTPHSIRQVIEEIFTLCGNKSDLDEVQILMKGKKTTGEIDTQFMDYEKAREYFGWSPKHTFTQGLVKTIEWFKTYNEYRYRSVK